MTDLVEMPPLEHMQLVRIQPGDVLVLRVRGRISHAQSEAIKDRVRVAFGDDGLPVLVIDDGAELAIARNETTERDRPVRYPDDPDH